MPSPPCDVSSQTAAELAYLLSGGPLGGEDVDRPCPTWNAPVFPGAKGEPQDSASQSSSRHTASYTHLIQAFLTSLSKLPVSSASHHCVSAGTGFPAPIPLVCLVGVISFPEPEGEMLESAPLFSFFPKIIEQMYCCKSLVCPAKQGAQPTPTISQDFLLFPKGPELYFLGTVHLTLPVRTQTTADRKHSSLAYAENKYIDSSQNCSDFGCSLLKAWRRGPNDATEFAFLSLLALSAAGRPFSSC